MSVKELAVTAQVGKRTIDNYMRREGSMPPADKLLRIAKVLGVTVEELFCGSSWPPGVFAVSLPTPSYLVHEQPVLPHDIQSILADLQQMDETHRAIVAQTAKAVLKATRRKTRVVS
jgi:transcriptional regulator with XRE-family HTH domain